MRFFLRFNFAVTEICVAVGLAKNGTRMDDIFIVSTMPQQLLITALIFSVCNSIESIFTFSQLLVSGICISRPPDLCLTPGPQFVFTGPGPQFVFTDPGPKFLFTGPGQSGACACIYQPCPPNLHLLVLPYDFYYCALILHLPSCIQQQQWQQ